MTRWWLGAAVGVSVALSGPWACGWGVAAAEDDPADEAEPEAPEPPSLHLQVPDDALAARHDFPMPLRQALEGRRWKEAATLLDALDPTTQVGAGKANLAFVKAWVLVRADRARDAAPLLGLIEGGAVPEAYVALLRGEVDRAMGHRVEALESLRQVPHTAAISPRARVQEAEVLRDLGRTREAAEIYHALADRPDPSDGGALVLLAAARSVGMGSDRANALLRRLHTYYPLSEEAAEAERRLKEHQAPAPTPEASLLRAEKLMDASHFDSAIRLASPLLPDLAPGSEADCRGHYVVGRSMYRRNRLSDSVVAFGDAGLRCADHPDYGAPILYLKGSAESRLKRRQSAEATFLALADLYADHRLGDDGLTRAGVERFEAGDLEGAIALWSQAPTRFPEGDTVPEAAVRQAFALYERHRSSEAIVAADAAARLAVGGEDLAAARYWAARLRMYPDARDPRRPVADEGRRLQAIQRWAALCEDMPWSFYAILAHSRLREVAPSVAEQLNPRPKWDPADAWQVRRSFWEDPAVQEGVALARLGLVGDALALWSRAESAADTPDEVALIHALRLAAGDPVRAHKSIHAWLRSHPPGTLGDREQRVIRVGYPDMWYDLVLEHTADYPFEPRLFHALMREESTFDPVIVSHAGARGLSQLMPPTARDVARWVGVPYVDGMEYDPSTNVRLGSRYLHVVLKQNAGSPFLALAGYNAGPTRVRGWVDQWSNPPTDEFVEKIPFRETRGYVRRVMGTWQTMRWFLDEDVAPYPDLSAYNHQVWPGR